MSVSDVNRWPRASRPSRSSRKFSMIPLWMTVISPVQSWCGWALRSFGPAVGRPAGVGEADRRVRRPVGDRVRRLASLPAFFSTNRSPPSSTSAMPGRVVAAVLEAGEPLDEDRARLPGSGVSDDAAHRVSPPLIVPTAARDVVTPSMWAPALV